MWDYPIRQNKNSVARWVNKKKKEKKNEHDKTVYQNNPIVRGNVNNIANIKSRRSFANQMSKKANRDYLGWNHT